MTQIFITRPVNQADELLTALNEKKRFNHQFVHWPLFKFEDIELNGQSQTWLYDFDCYDYVFVASKHAATKLCEHLDEKWPMLPIGPVFICPGSGTASVLNEFGIDAVYPKKQMDSEGVLSLSMFDNSELNEPKKWLVVSGQGGRRKISAHLDAHNQSIDELDLYTRVTLQQPPSNTCCENDVVIITSQESLEQAQQILGEKIQILHLWVSSERIKQSALNWQSISVMQNASDQIIIQTVNSYE